MEKGHMTRNSLYCFQTSTRKWLRRINIKQAWKPLIHGTFLSLLFFPFLSPITLEVPPLSHLTGLLLLAWGFLCRFHCAENPIVLYSDYTSMQKSKTRLSRLCCNGHSINDETGSISESLQTSVNVRREIPTHFCRWTNSAYDKITLKNTILECNYDIVTFIYMYA